MILILAIIYPQSTADQSITGGETILILGIIYLQPTGNQSTIGDGTFLILASLLPTFVSLCFLLCSISCTGSDTWHSTECIS